MTDVRGKCEACGKSRKLIDLVWDKFRNKVVCGDCHPRRCRNCSEWGQSKTGAWGLCRRNSLIRQFDDGCDNFTAIHKQS